MKRAKLWRVLTIVACILFAVILAVITWANNYPSIVTSAIGGQTYKIVKGEDSDNEDTMRYPSNGMSLDDWIDEEMSVIREVQGGGSILLKNEDNALPLKHGAKVSAFGYYTVNSVSSGLGTYVSMSYMNFKEAMEVDGNLVINPTLYSYFESKATDRLSLNKLQEVDISDITSSVQASYSDYSDAAIVVIGRAGGEGSDLDYEGTSTPDGTRYLTLQENEKKILKEACDHFSKVIVIIDGSYAMELGWLFDEEYANVKACLFVGAVGYNGFQAVSDILTGVTNPSGKTVDTFAANSLSSPAMVNFGNYTYTNGDDVASTTGVSANNVTHYVVEKEGIYVGYKYYETRYEDSILNQGNAASSAGAFEGSTWDYDKEVVFPFGYGLSYTTFEYSNFSVKDNGTTFTVSVTVKNTGDTAGREVVEVYAQTPYTDFDKENGIEAASVQLCGYGKTQLLAAGASETLEISVDKEDLCHYDSYVNETYIMEAGQYYLTAAADAHSAVNNILKAKGKDVDGDADFVYTGFDPKNTDTETYAATEDGVIITNRFDDIDLNNWVDSSAKVTYLSRQNWSGTWPTEETSLTANSKMITALAATSTYEPGSSDLSEYTLGADTGYTVAMMIGKDIDDPAWEDILNQLSTDDLCELVCRSGLAAVESISYPACFMKDGSHAATSRNYDGSGTYILDNYEDSGTPAMTFPSEVIMAAAYDRDLMSTIGITFGEDNIRTCTTGRYAPSVNIHRTPYSGRNFEYYSEDGYLNGQCAVNVIKEMSKKGVITTLKHFAFNDQETNRQGICTFMTQQAAREIYLEGFKAGVVEGKTHGIMEGFNRIGCTWTGAHYGLLTNVLREEWGSTAVIDTDATAPSTTGYMNFAAGVAAGTCMWASSGAVNSDCTAAAKVDSKLVGNLRNSAKYILYNVVNSLAFNGISASDQIVPVLAWWQTTLIVVEVIVGIVFVGAAFMTVFTEIRKNKKGE